MNSQLFLTRKVLLLFLLTFCGANAFSQQELSLHFMRNLIQNTETNPGNIIADKFTFSLPSFYGNVNHSGFSLKDLGTIDNGIFTLAPEAAIDNLDGDNNIIQGNVNLSVAAITFRVKDLQFKLFHNSNVDFYGFYPKALPEMLWYGNGEFVGEVLDIAPQIDFFAYQEYGMGFAIQANERLSIGTNLKYLNGLASLKTIRSEAKLFTNPDYYQLSAETDFSIYSSGFSAFLDGETDDLIDRGDDPNIFISQNSGLSMDFGLNYKVSEKWEVAANAIDLGFINWRESTKNQFSEGKFDFEGVKVQPFDEIDDFDFDNALDSIDNLVDFQTEILENGYRTQLPTRFYLSTNYQLDSTLSLGGLVYGELYRGYFNPAIALNAQKRLGRWLEFGGLVGWRRGNIPNLGLNLSLRLGALQIYGLTDNLLPLIDFESMQQFNFRVGVNIAVRGKKDTRLSEPELIAEEQVAPESLDMKKEKIKKKKPGKEVTPLYKKRYFRRADKY